MDLSSKNQATEFRAMPADKNSFPFHAVDRRELFLLHVSPFIVLSYNEYNFVSYVLISFPLVQSLI